MKVWALCDCFPYEDWWIVGLFSSEEKLEEYVQENDLRTPVKKQLRVHMWIAEYEVDE